MTCQWKSGNGANKCARNVYGNSEYCIFHKPAKTKQEAAIFWHVLNFDPFSALPTEVKAMFSVNFFFCEGKSELLKYFAKTGICSFVLDEPKTLVVDKVLENSVQAYLNRISPDKDYQKEILYQWKGSGLHGSNSGFFEGFIFPVFGGPFDYKYLLLNQMHTFYFIDNLFEGQCWFEGYDFGNNHVQFVNVKIKRQVSFENTVFRGDVMFTNTDLNTRNSYEGKYPFFNAKFMGQELRFVSGSIANIYGINISENTNLRIDDDVKIAELRSNEFGSNMVNAKEETLRIAKNQAKRRGEYDIAGEYYYKEKEAMRKQIFKKFQREYPRQNNTEKRLSYISYFGNILFYKTLWTIICTTLSRLILGYGERPSWALLSSFIVMAGYGFVYYFFDLLCSQQKLPFCSSIFFSVVTFTTVGYGDITPRPGWGQAISSSEMIIGVTFIALWTATLVRKMTR